MSTELFFTRNFLALDTGKLTMKKGDCPAINSKGMSKIPDCWAGAAGKIHPGVQTRDQSKKIWIRKRRRLPEFSAGFFRNLFSESFRVSRVRCVSRNQCGRSIFMTLRFPPERGRDFRCRSGLIKSG